MGVHFTHEARLLIVARLLRGQVHAHVRGAHHLIPPRTQLYVRIRCYVVVYRDHGLSHEYVEVEHDDEGRGRRWCGLSA